MKEILILFLIFGTLFSIESKSIYLLAYYVAMVILIAILINIYPDLNNTLFSSCDISYISYILVLVQISAITILFGFIIMLYPTNNTDILHLRGEHRYLKYKTKYSVKRYFNLFPILIVFIIGFTVILYVFVDMYYFEILNLVNIIYQFDIYDRIIYILTDSILEISNPYNIIIMDNNVSLFINKISYLLYTDPSNIFKFIVLTIILLFAIICLFFLLFPTIKK